MLKIKLVIGLLIAVFLIGCGGKEISKKDAKQYSQIDSNEVSVKKTFLVEDTLYVKYIVEDTPFFIKTKIPTENKKDVYLHTISQILLEKKPNLEYKEKDLVVYLEETAWDNFVNKAVEFIAPKTKTEATLFFIQHYEVVVYKDKNNKNILADLKDLPTNIKITKSITKEYFEDLFTNTIIKEVTSSHKGRTKFLLKTKGMLLTPYIYLDTKNKIFTAIMLPDYYSSFGEIPSLYSSAEVLYSAIVRSHFIKIITAPVTSLGRLWGLLKYSLFSAKPFAVHNIKGKIPSVNPGAEPMDLEDFNMYLNKNISPKTYKGTLKFLIDGEQFFPHFIQTVNNAKSNVLIRIYLFGTDEYAIKIADLLKDISENIKTQIILDDIIARLGGVGGSTDAQNKDFKQPRSITSYLQKDSKIKIHRNPNTFFVMDHTKILTIDRQKTYIGGMNIGREYRYYWHDMMAYLEGPIAGRFAKDFYVAYYAYGAWGDLGFLYAKLFRKKRTNTNKVITDDMIDIRPLYTKTNNPQIYKAQIEAIRRAKKYIYLEHAYFSSNAILNELIRARERGVDVRVILPGINNVGIMNKSNLTMANKMLRNGIKVYVYDGMSHIKAGIFDGWACLGSANLDKSSLFTNKEVNIAFDDKKHVDILLKDLFLKDLSKSREIKEKLELSWGDYTSGFFANQL
ncbi:MAG: phosphatidylserine/phosphatidylglycerophosphate/cardiolipin synthase family protein [Elusimicrobiaceae bacterium]|nr:phosphatidylserine/phosphatidylglycerophosphate/cardiolipin synthase family protein [Elusimicrobiaceae bacterium]